MYKLKLFTILSIIVLQISCVSTETTERGFNKGDNLPNLIGYTENNDPIELSNHLSPTTILFFWDPRDEEHTQWLYHFDKLVRTAKEKKSDISVIAISYKSNSTGNLVKSHKAARETSMLFNASDIVFSFADNTMKQHFNYIKAPKMVVTDQQGTYITSFDKMRELGKYLIKPRS